MINFFVFDKFSVFYSVVYGIYRTFYFFKVISLKKIIKNSKCGEKYLNIYQFVKIKYLQN